MSVRCLAPAALALAAVLVTAAAPAHAQPVVGQAPVALRPPSASPPAPSRSRALRRIASGLEDAGATANGAALRVDGRRVVDLVGGAPVAVGAWLDEADTVAGAPAPGAPTHDDLLSLFTPPQFRSTSPYRRWRPSLALWR